MLSSLVASRLEEEAIDDVDEADSEMPVPQLKLSADGKIILDPKSLVCFNWLLSQYPLTNLPLII